MASMNKVFLVGNLCADVEVRQAGGVSVATLRMAIDDSYKAKSGEKVERAVFVDVDVWDRMADSCAKFVGKGNAILVEGKLHMDSWDDKDSGQKRTKIKVRAERVQFLTFKEKQAQSESEQLITKTKDKSGDDIPF